MRRAVYVIFLIALLFLPCKSVYAVEKSYLQPEDWINNSDIYSENISKKSNMHSIKGVFKYYFDSHNNVFYTYFSIAETSLSKNKCDIRVVYTIKNVFDTYIFSVDKDGVCDSSFNVDDYFTVNQNFTTYKDSNTGLYLSSVAIHNGCEHNDISVKFYVNGHVYKISDNVVLEIMTENEAVLQSETSENNIVAKNKSSTESRKTSKKTTADKSKTAKAEKTSTTKFHYKAKQGNYSYSEQIPQKEASSSLKSETTVSDESIQQSEAEKQKGSMTPSAKTCCAASGVLSLGAVSFLAVSALSKPKKGKINIED